MPIVLDKLHHVSRQTRNVDETRKFYVEVLGGRLILDGTPHFSEVLVAGTVVGLSDVRGKPQQPDAEFPHIGFEIESEHFIFRSTYLGNPITVFRKRKCTAEEVEKFHALVGYEEEGN